MAHPGWVYRAGQLSRGSYAKDRRTAAIHEAAHAVVAHEAGARVLRLRLYDRKSGLLCRGWTETEWVKPKDPLLFAVFSLAGHEAERIAYGRPGNCLPDSDWYAVWRLHFTDRSASMAGWLARIWVRRLWGKIRATQAALIRDGELGRKEFLRAIRP